MNNVLLIIAVTDAWNSNKPFLVIAPPGGRCQYLFSFRMYLYMKGVRPL